MDAPFDWPVEPVGSRPAAEGVCPSVRSAWRSRPMPKNTMAMAAARHQAGIALLARVRRAPARPWPGRRRRIPGIRCIRRSGSVPACRRATPRDTPSRIWRSRCRRSSCGGCAAGSASRPVPSARRTGTGSGTRSSARRSTRRPARPARTRAVPPRIAEEVQHLDVDDQAVGVCEEVGDGRRPTCSRPHRRRSASSRYFSPRSAMSSQRGRGKLRRNVYGPASTDIPRACPPGTASCKTLCGTGTTSARNAMKRNSPAGWIVGHTGAVEQNVLQLHQPGDGQPAFDAGGPLDSWRRPAVSAQRTQT